MLWIVPITILDWQLACLPSLVVFSVISLCVYSIRDGSKEGRADCPCCTKEKKVIDASKIQSQQIVSVRVFFKELKIGFGLRDYWKL